MRGNRLLWALAIVLMLASASDRLARSEDTTSDRVVRVELPDTVVGGELHRRRFPSSDPERVDLMVRSGSALEGTLPRQPPGGKLA